MALKAVCIVVCTVFGLLAGTPAMAASKLPRELIDLAVQGCIESDAVIWATPGSAPLLCPCFVQNVLEMRLTDAQRLRVLQVVGGRVMEPFQRPLSVESRAEAFRVGMDYQQGCYLQ